LNLETIVFLVIAMNLYAGDSIEYVLEKMARGRGLLEMDNEPAAPPRDSALVYRRYQLGARTLAALFRRVCRPIATKETPGARSCLVCA
jgi:hypothetical protein